MSDKTISVMKEHLLIAETYIKELDKASGKEALMDAITSCRDKVQAQYPELESISDDFEKRIGAKEKELCDISKKAGDLFGKEITKFYGKMGPFMADKDFMEAFASLDVVVGNNPLFGKNEFGADVAAQVAQSVAGSIDDVAMKMMSETEETDEVTVANIAELMDHFLTKSKLYVDKMRSANTSRKVVLATDGYVDGIKRLIPEMREYTDRLKLIMSKPVKPEEIMRIADELKKTLGDDLKDVMKDKGELMQEQKVQKSVGKLGAILNEVPF